MEISIFLAKVMGLYFFLVSLAGFVQGQKMQKLAKNMVHSPEIFFLMGLNGLVIGILLVVIHNRWVFSWPLLITLISWIVLLKGITALFFPDQFRAFSEKYAKKNYFFVPSMVVSLLIGIFLLYVGFFQN